MLDAQHVVQEVVGLIGVQEVLAALGCDLGFAQSPKGRGVEGPGLVGATVAQVPERIARAAVSGQFKGGVGWVSGRHGVGGGYTLLTSELYTHGSFSSEPMRLTMQMRAVDLPLPRTPV